MTAKHARRLELYRQGRSDKEIAEAEGAYPSLIGSWRVYHHLPCNRVFRPEPATKPLVKLTRCTGIPMEQALNPDQCAVVRQFFADLLTAADRCQGKKDIGQFMREWHRLAAEGKAVRT